PPPSRFRSSTTRRPSPWRISCSSCFLPSLPTGLPAARPAPSSGRPEDDTQAALADPSGARHRGCADAGAVLLGAEDEPDGREHLRLSAGHPAGEPAPVLLRGRLVCHPLLPLSGQQRRRLGH